MAGVSPDPGNKLYYCRFLVILGALGETSHKRLQEFCCQSASTADAASEKRRERAGDKLEALLGLCHVTLREAALFRDDFCRRCNVTEQDFVSVR